MAIENRELAAGTRLVASYRKQAFVCTVTEGDDGKSAFVLEDGRRFKSPSAAGSAVMGGTACNGWRFWSVEGEEPAPVAADETSGRTPKRAKGLIRRTPNQQGVAEGQTRWFCSGCMKGFTAPAADGAPDVCPEGHRADDPRFG